MLLGVQFCIHGEKDILGGVCGSGARGGFSASILVGLRGNHSDSVCRMVGGLPQRLVLGELISQAVESGPDVSGLVRVLRLGPSPARALVARRLLCPRMRDRERR